MMRRWLGPACLLCLLAPAAFANIVWRGDFSTGDLSQWESVEEVSKDRLTIVQSPVSQDKHSLRVLLRQGDNPINASGNRNELARTFLQQEGSEYYYRWRTMFPSDYPSENTWQVFTQFHQNTCCGSPPLEFDVQGEKIELISGPSEKILWSTPLVRNAWHDFIFHVRWSANASVGFVEMYYDGKLVLPKQYLATGADTYLKQGLYRNSSIAEDAIVYHEGMVQGTTLEDVRPSPPASPSTSGSTPVASSPSDPAVPGPSGLSPANVSASAGPPRLISATNGCSGGAASAMAPFGLGVFGIGNAVFRRRRKK